MLLKKVFCGSKTKLNRFLSHRTSSREPGCWRMSLQKRSKVYHIIISQILLLSDLATGSLGMGCGPWSRKEASPAPHNTWPLSLSWVSPPCLPGVVVLGGGWNHNSHPPPYLRSLRVAEFRICRCPAGVGILRILLICVSVVEGKRRGEIQNSPEKGSSKKLTKDILFSRDKHPGFPSQGSLGLESCLLVRDPHRQPYPLIQHRADCEVFWMCPVV